MFLKAETLRRTYIFLFVITGFLELDMCKLVRPKKNPGSCVEDSNDLMDLFQAKSVKGWWMLLGETEAGGIMPKVKLFEHAK